MARPKKNTEDKAAYERMEDAFWFLLAKMPYNKITLTALREKAQVNHNLVYYYFENIDDMACRLFEKNMDSDFSSYLLSSFMSGKSDYSEVLANLDYMKRLGRARLFMRDDSAFLNRIVKDRLQKEWMNAIGVFEEKLTVENKVDLDFIFSGLIAVMGSSSFDENIQAVVTLYRRTLGQGVIRVLKELSMQESVSE